jgi:hypothetical protein
MPRFFIDTNDGDFPVIDEDGADYRDLASAEDMAMRTLPEMAQSRHPARNWREISATVRDETGVVRFQASLTLAVVRGRTDQTSMEMAAA